MYQINNLEKSNNWQRDEHVIHEKLIFRENKIFNECKEIGPMTGKQHCTPSVKLEFKF
jgi:hypothetical protein